MIAEMIVISFMFLIQTIAIVYLISKVRILQNLLDKTIDFTYEIGDSQNNTSKNLLELLRIMNGRYRNEN